MTGKANIMNQFFKPGQTVLFQGDSITDCGRGFVPNPDGMAYGYAHKVATIYNQLFSDDVVSNINRCPLNEGEGYPPKDADSGVRFVNRGVSGNKTPDLLARYQKDFVEVKPDFLSILIGTNEVLHHQQDKPETYFPPEQFEKNYKQLMSQLRRDLPDTKIMLIQPFIFTTFLSDYRVWEKELIHISSIVRDIAFAEADYYLPMWDIYNMALARKEVTGMELSKDGIHPSPKGHSLLARAYLHALDII